MAGLPSKLVLLAALGLAFAQTPAPGDLVLHFDVNLVQVDAIVTDSRGTHLPSGSRQEQAPVRRLPRGAFLLVGKRAKFLSVDSLASLSRTWGSRTVQHGR
jgi:hypothetical protein